MEMIRVVCGVHVFVALLVAPAVQICNSQTCENNRRSALSITHQLLQVLINSSYCDCGASTALQQYSSLSSGLPNSCADIQANGVLASGVYRIGPKPWLGIDSFDVYCDMNTTGGGWTVIQRRDEYDTQENFTRDWDSYAKGFGNIRKDFWLGNNKLFALTNQECVILRFDMGNYEDESRYAEYRGAVVASAKEGYKLTFGAYSGDAGDSMATHNGRNFSTYDKGSSRHCAVSYKGGWWYNSCHTANPNGRYLRGKNTAFAEGITWFAWLGYNYSLKKMEMKLRPCLYFGVNATTS